MSSEMGGLDLQEHPQNALTLKKRNHLIEEEVTAGGKQKSPKSIGKGGVPFKKKAYAGLISSAEPSILGGATKPIKKPQDAKKGGHIIVYRTKGGLVSGQDKIMRGRTGVSTGNKWRKVRPGTVRKKFRPPVLPF